MAHKKAGGSSRLGRDSAGRRLGLKMNHGQAAKAGQIIVRQRGTKYHPGNNVRVGKDDTLYAASDGVIEFKSKRIKRFDGKLKPTQLVSVVKK